MSELMTRTNGEVAAAEQAPERPVYVPHTDILETADGYVLLADLPGVAQDDLDVTYEKGILTIKASPSLPAHEGFHLAYGEYQGGNYYRTFRLSDQLDPGGISASIKDGVLRVVLPRPESASRKITVNVVD